MKTLRSLLCVFLIVIFSGCRPLKNALPEKTVGQIPTLDKRTNTDATSSLYEQGMFYIASGVIKATLMP